MQACIHAICSRAYMHSLESFFCCFSCKCFPRYTLYERSVEDILVRYQLTLLVKYYNPSWYIAYSMKLTDTECHVLVSTCSNLLRLFCPFDFLNNLLRNETWADDALCASRLYAKYPFPTLAVNFEKFTSHIISRRRVLQSHENIYSGWKNTFLSCSGSAGVGHWNNGCQGTKHFCRRLAMLSCFSLQSFMKLETWEPALKYILH